MASDPPIARTTDFDRVLADELGCIQRARPEATPDDLQALALSGGGVRSATFNLGLLQALCERGLLRRFDYLSTVSGGGYIGSWLTAQRRHGRSVDELERTLSPTEPDAKAPDGRVAKAEEDPSIRFLRQYSNYLTPRVGPLSTDTLTAVATYLRNVIVIQATLISLLIAVFLVPRVLHAIVECLPESAWQGVYFSAAGLAGLALVGLALLAIFLNVRALPTDWKAGDRFVLLCVMLPAVAGALVVIVALSQEALFPLWPMFWLLGLAYGALGAVLALLPASEYYAVVVRVSDWQALDEFVAAAARGEVRLGSSGQDAKLALKELREGKCDAVDVRTSSWSRPSVVQGDLRVLEATPVHPSALRASDELPWTRVWKAILIFVFALVAGAIGCLLTGALHGALRAMDPPDAILFSVSVGPFVLLLLFSLVVVIHLGLVGRIFDDQLHEWWARYGAWVLKLSFWAGGAAAIAVYGPAVVAWVVAWSWKLVAAGGAAWVGTTLWGLVKGVSPSTSGERSTWTERLLPAAPYLFILGLALALAWAIHPALTTPALAPFAMALVVVACVVLTRRLDVNLFSLNAMYRNRLTRCYLGAARTWLPEGSKRAPHPFTGFDPRDDVALAACGHRPYQLVNATLNINSGKNLAWQHRKAASFFLSPRYCGFQFREPDGADKAGGFAATGAYMGGAKLGSAMGISGAALSPNAGYHTSPPVAFLLTLFNLRVGRWCPNPAPGHDSVQARQSPRDGGRVLLRELFALTDASSPYVYLSDGGHFDNTGIYELVRRRVHFILAADCGQDEHGTFDDLADVMRKCYVDFGVRIELDVDALKPDGGPLGASREHSVTGKIVYPKQGGLRAFTGTLVLVKPGLSAGLLREAPDLLNYRLVHKQFPQHSTADQWFDEPQFESYRKLGYLIGRRVQL